MSKEIIKTKICKICGKEKPVNEFQKSKNYCKLCNWLKKEYNQNKIKLILDKNKKWNKIDIIKIINIFLCSDTYFVNELTHINKNLNLI